MSDRDFTSNLESSVRLAAFLAAYERANAHNRRKIVAYVALCWLERVFLVAAGILLTAAVILMFLGYTMAASALSGILLAPALFLAVFSVAVGGAK